MSIAICPACHKFSLHFTGTCEGDHSYKCELCDLFLLSKDRIEPRAFSSEKKTHTSVYLAPETLALLRQNVPKKFRSGFINDLIVKALTK